jgi:hypothetical protein
MLALTALLAACSPAAPPANNEAPQPAPSPAEPAPAEPASAAADDPAPETKQAAAEEAPAEADPLGPLPAQARATLESIRFDPRPDEITRNSHYWVSNEQSHFFWHELIKDLGGVHVGVGTDQNYLLAGWARSELIVLLDFDRAIPLLHQVYRVMFDMADTPEAFVDLWLEESIPAVAAKLDEAYPDHPQLDRIKRNHTIARKLVSARLRNVRRQYRKAGIPTFLSDQDQYDHIRKLWANGRVIAIRGDLTGDRAVMDTSKAVRALGLEVTVLYLSNAEQYFEFVPTYRRNIISIPFAEKSWVLRTLGWKMHGYAEGEQYHYNAQDGRNFADWMRISKIKAVPYLLKSKTDTGVQGSSTMNAPPIDYGKPPEIAP